MSLTSADELQRSYDHAITMITNPCKWTSAVCIETSDLCLYMCTTNACICWPLPVYVDLCLYMLTFACICGPMSVYVDLCLYMPTSVCICRPLPVYVDLCPYICRPLSVYVDLCLYMSTYVRTYVYLSLYMSTYMYDNNNYNDICLLYKQKHIYANINYG